MGRLLEIVKLEEIISNCDISNKAKVMVSEEVARLLEQDLLPSGLTVNGNIVTILGIGIVHEVKI